jgi:uncharacterized Zn finger protein
MVRKDPEAYAELCARVGQKAEDCRAIAEILGSKGRWSEALDWVERGLALAATNGWQGSGSYRLESLKRELLRKLGKPQEALQSAWVAFEHHPDTFSYEELMRYVPRSDRAEWRRRALTAAAAGRLSDYMNLCVKLKEWLILAEKVLATAPETLEKISHYSSEPAADGLAKCQPAAAARLYTALGLRVVKAGKSQYYGAALRNLQSARECYQRSEQCGLWNALVARIRSEHRRKSGFMPGFERIVAGKAAALELSFVERAEQRWRWPASHTSRKKSSS